ncbi:MAG: hypothetical protein QOI20_3485, partial [Acidimicrobiaceae bacterium]|nr:hypothetical protein [Acidimicrobiaceae bacterium]
MRTSRWLGAVAAVVVMLAAAPVVTATKSGTAHALSRAAVIDRIATYADFAPPAESSLVVRQPDGTQFRARLTPAQLGGALEVDGYSVARGTDGWWRFASTDARVAVDQRPGNLTLGVSRVDLTPNAVQRDARLQVLNQLRNASMLAQQRA